MTVICTDIEQAKTALQTGAVIAYPTEAVFGLGCVADDQSAVEKILTLKQRPIEKGLITLIDDLTQVIDWLDSNFSSLWCKAEASWPAAITWLLPCSQQAPHWLTGGASQIALRCPDHPIARQLCKAAPLVSTSANKAGQVAAKTAEQVMCYFPNELDLIVTGECNAYSQPSQIRELISDKILR